MDEYTNNAKFYDPIVGPFLRSTHKDIVDILQNHGCHNVLDLCCGTGLFAGQAQNAGMHLTGVDISPTMLDVARTNLPEIDFLQHDASSLPMGNETYDAVTISFALHEKPREVALAITKEALRLVRKDGLLVVADYRYPTKRKSIFIGWIIRLVEHMAGTEHNAHFQNYMKQGGSEVFLAEAGLNATRLTTHMGGWSGVFVQRGGELEPVSRGYTQKDELPDSFANT